MGPRAYELWQRANEETAEHERADWPCDDCAWSQEERDERGCNGQATLGLTEAEVA